MTGSSSTSSASADRRRSQNSTAFPASARPYTRGPFLHNLERWHEEWLEEEGQRACAHRGFAVQPIHRQSDVLSEVSESPEKTTEAR